jgi:hypothetical protein
VEFPYSSLNQKGGQQPVYKSYNNFEVMPQVVPQMVQQNIQPDISEEEEVGEMLYSLVERQYPK